MKLRKRKPLKRLGTNKMATSENNYIRETPEFMADPAGCRWTKLLGHTELNPEVVTLLVDAFQNKPEELAGIYNWILTRDPRGTKEIKRKDWDILKRGAKEWIEKRIKGEIEPIKNVDPFDSPAPLSLYEEQRPRGVLYDVQGVVSAKTLCNFYLLRGDSWGNLRHPGWVPHPPPKNEMGLKDLENLRNEMARVREKHINWLLCEGFSLEMLKMLPPLRKECEIWKSRASYYQADNISGNAAIEMETIDGLEWECLMMYRLVPTYRLPRDFRKKDPHTSTSWFAKADTGNVAVSVPSSDASTTAKVAPIYKSSIVVDYDQVMEETMIPITVKEANIKLEIVDNITTTDVTKLMTRLDYKSPTPSDADSFSPPGQVSPIYGVKTTTGELASRSAIFADLSAIAPITKTPLKVQMPPPISQSTPAITGPNVGVNALFNPSAAVGAVSDPDIPIKGKASFTGKYVADQIPEINMQKGEVDDLYRLGKIIQRYAENKNCDEDVLLDAIISKTSPSDANIAWLKKHFSQSFEKRRNFFPVYRARILPFFDLARLTERAIAYKLDSKDREPARIKAAEYADYMKPYLMLAKNPQDRIATENLMKSRFWNFLGMQVRQPFEDMLIKNNTDPYQLTLDNLAEALKAYSLAVGGEVYARPDAPEDHVILSMNVKEYFKSDAKGRIENGKKESKNLGQGSQKVKPEPASVSTNKDQNGEKGRNFGFKGYNQGQRNGGFRFNNWNRNQDTKQVTAIGQTPNLVETIAAALAGTIGKPNPDPVSQKKAEIPPPRNYEPRKFNKGKGNQPGKGNWKPQESRESKSQTAAAMATQGDKNQSPVICYACGIPGHVVRDCQLYRDTDDPTYNIRRVCNICKKRGHIFSDCPEKKGN